MTWSLFGKENSTNILVFENYGEFLKQAENIDFETPIYIDQNLGSGVKGTDIANKVSNMGFNKIFLATGYEPDQIKTDLASAPYLISMQWNQVELIDLPRKQQRAK